MEPYENALKWIKEEGLSKLYGDSGVPEQQRMWDRFVSRDREGMDMLLKIEANQCPRLTEKTSGQAVAEQVFILFSHDIDGSPL